MRFITKTMVGLAFLCVGFSSAERGWAAEIVTTNYPSGRLKDQFSVDEWRRPTGVYKTFYDDVNKETGRSLPKGSAKFKDGVLHGAFVRLYPNGKPHVKATYKNGALDGTYTEYTAAGQVIEQSEYANGLLEKATVPRKKITIPVMDDDVYSGSSRVTITVGGTRTTTTVPRTATPAEGFIEETPAKPLNPEENEEALKKIYGGRPDRDEEDAQLEDHALMENRVEIIRASYGSGNMRVDATEKLRRAYKMDNLESLRPYNETFGDPCSGWVKTVQVTFKREDGTEGYAEYWEGDALVIPPAKKD